MLRFLTAGESHGKGLAVIIDGVPANLKIKPDDIDSVLAARQQGYGRGGRQQIEKDRVEILSGIRFGKTTGAPLSFIIKNRDYENWLDIMDLSKRRPGIKEYNVPRPGHADLAGGIKFRQYDFRNVLERASARETAARAAAGAVAKKILEELNIKIIGFTASIGDVHSFKNISMGPDEISAEIKKADKKTGAVIRMPDPVKAALAKKAIMAAAGKKDTLGGRVGIVTSPIAPGIGDYTQWDKKLDGLISMAVMSLQSVKAVSIGAGFEYAEKSGAAMHDAIKYSEKKGYYRKTNNSGGFEGGMTNGMPVRVFAALKPISTVGRGVETVDIKSKNTTRTVYERSDVCAVPAAAVIAEGIVAVELVKGLQRQFGGDEMLRMKKAYFAYKKYTEKF